MTSQPSVTFGKPGPAIIGHGASARWADRAQRQRQASQSSRKNHVPSHKPSHQDSSASRLVDCLGPADNVVASVVFSWIRIQVASGTYHQGQSMAPDQMVVRNTMRS